MTSPRLLVFVGLCLGGNLILGANAESPWEMPVKPTWPEDKVGNVTDRQGEYCAIQLRPDTDVDVVLESLAGRKISVAVNLFAQGQTFFNFAHYNESTGLMTGYLVDVMDEMARIGKFTWRDSFVLINESDVRKTERLDLAVWATQNYDIFIDWVSPELERTAAGINQLMAFMDTSYHLVVRPRVEELGFLEEIFSFLAPFQYTVWFALFVILFITAKFYQFFEKGQSDFEEAGVEKHEFQHSVYLTLGTFTGVTGFSPGTSAGKFMNFSCAFLVLLVVSAYTANLASLLVLSDDLMIPVQSLEEAAVKGIPVCTAYESASDTFDDVQNLQFKQVPLNMDTYNFVRNGTCKAGLIRSFIWKFARNSALTNKGCTLFMLPDILLEESSGFVTRVDQHNKRFCIERAAQLFNLILLKMQTDGFFKQLQKRYRKLTPEPITCPAGLPLPPGASSQSLSFASMSGIFLTYAFSLAIAFVIHKNTPKPGSKEDSLEMTSDSESLM